MARSSRPTERRLFEYTLISHEADFRLFLGWCGKARLMPLPGTPITIAAYLTDRMAATEHPETPAGRNPEDLSAL